MTELCIALDHFLFLENIRITIRAGKIINLGFTIYFRIASFGINPHMRAALYILSSALKGGEADGLQWWKEATMKSLSRLVYSPFVTHRNPRAPSPPKGRARRTRASFPASAAAASPSESRYPSFSAQYEPGEKPVVVVGSANADIYVEVDRLPAVGETISARTGQTLAGGKGANQACCGGKLAHPTYFVGQVGEDAHGRLIEEALESGGVLLGHLTRVPAAPTGHAVVMLQPDGQNSIIIVGGANVSGWPERLSEEDLEVVRKAGVLLLQREIPDQVNIQVAEVFLTSTS